MNKKDGERRKVRHAARGCEASREKRMLYIRHGMVAEDPLDELGPLRRVRSAATEQALADDRDLRVSVDSSL